MNILVTGGCGFIGVNLIRRIMDEGGGHRIRVIDNLSVGKREDLEQIQRPEVRGQRSESGRTGIELVVGDVRDAELAIKACDGMDAVVHLAASTGVMPSIEDPRSDCTANVVGTFNYLEAARLNKIKRFVFASSGAPLGEQKPPIHEEMVAKPISPYGASKLCGEAYCSAYYGSFGLDTMALRFGNVYGPRSTHKGSVIAKFIRHIFAGKSLPIYGDGNQTRDFIYVDDLVAAILLALEKSNVGGEVFQIATHREHTVGEVAEVLNRLAEKYLSRRSEIVYEDERKGEVRRNYSDISKARRVLGFEPKVSLEEGLERTFLWSLDNR